MTFAATISSTGVVTFGGALYSSAMTVNAGSGAYGIALNNGGTVTNAVVFTNTGTLGIGSGFGFTGGVTATAPSGVSVAGTVTAAGTGVLNFAAAGVSVTGTATIGGSSTGQISLGPTRYHLRGNADTRDRDQ